MRAVRAGGVLVLVCLPWVALGQSGGVFDIIGPEGTVRTTGKGIIQFVVWGGGFLGVLMFFGGLWKGIKEAAKPAQQPRDWNAPVWLTLGGAVLASFTVIYTLLGEAVTGSKPDMDMWELPEAPSPPPPPASPPPPPPPPPPIPV